MKRLRFSLAWLVLALSLCLAWPAWGLDLAGRVVGPDGAGVAGALISDQVGVTRSDAQGGWRLSSQEGRIVSVTAPAGHGVSGLWWLPAPAAQGRVWQLDPAPAPARLTLAILSDPHLTDPQALEAGCPPQPFPADLPMVAWRRAVSQAAQIKPDLTLVAGDLCLDADSVGSPCAQAQMSLAARAMALAPQPARAIPGNHDVTYPRTDQAQGAAPVDFTLWQEKLGPQRQVYLLGSLAVIMLDNTGRGRALNGRARSLGWLSPQALAWLEQVLAVLPQETPIIMVSHYPLSSPVVGANPLYGGALVEDVEPSATLDAPKPALRDVDQNAMAVFKLLARRKVLAFVSGHEHAWHQSWLHLRGGSWRFIGLPALCGRWWQGDRPWGPLAFAPGWLSLQIETQGDEPVVYSTFHEAEQR
jgi:hypothetical protein